MGRGLRRAALRACPGSPDGFGGGVWRGSGLARSRRWLLAAAVAGALCGSAGPADAQEDAEGGEEEAATPPPSPTALKLAEAKKQVEQLDFLGAQKALFELVQSGKATPEELSDAYFTLGSVEAALGNDVESRDAFYLALMIQPSLLFPEGGSPKIRERLNEARSRVTEVGVLQARAAVDDGVLEVHVDNDPLDLVKRVEVMMTREGGESGKVALEQGEMRAEVEPGVESIQVALYDEAGNQLKVLDVAPSGQPETGGAASDALKTPSVWESWGLWAGVAGAFAIGGTYFIMEAGNLDEDVQTAQDAPNPNPAEVERLQDDRDRVALYGVVGLSLAGAAAITSGALLLFGGDDEAGTEEAASFVPSFAPGHVGARFSLKF